jgi:hypothetical protein
MRGLYYSVVWYLKLPSIAMPSDNITPSGQDIAKGKAPRVKAQNNWPRTRQQVTTKSSPAFLGMSCTRGLYPL